MSDIYIDEVSSMHYIDEVSPNYLFCFFRFISKLKYFGCEEPHAKRQIVMSFVHVARELFMVWIEPRTLVGLCLELRRTRPDDLIFAVLTCHNEGEQYGFTVFLRYEAKSV